jgi:hypothetical protein
MLQDADVGDVIGASQFVADRADDYPSIVMVGGDADDMYSKIALYDWRSVKDPDLESRDAQLAGRLAEKGEPW